MTAESIKRTIQVVVAIGEAIRDLKEVPSGHLYAQLCGRLSLEDYEMVIQFLIDGKQITRGPDHLLKWIG